MTEDSISPIEQPADSPMEPAHPSGSAGFRWVRRVPWLRLAAELGAVFLGVTLGLLADDWRESRTDRRDDEEALLAFLADLAADSVDLNNLRSNMEVDDSSAMWIRQRLGQPGVDVDSAALRIIAIFDAQSYQGPRATYAGLRSAGRLGLIGDDELRRAITNYYEELQPHLVGYYNAYDELWYPFRKAASLDWQLVYAQGSRSYDLRGVVGLRLGTSWERFPTDPQLRYYLEELGVLSSVIAAQAQSVLDRNAALRASIQANLRR